MRPWCLENPTVRSPFRLRDGLVALSQSPLQGQLRGKEQEIAFRNMLGELGIVTLGSDRTFSVSRKWRLAMNRRGFLYPPVSKASTITQRELGAIDMITPNGWRLVQAETVPGMQECFLRSLAAYYIPSDFERGYEFPVFSPLRHVLAVMLAIWKLVGESRLNFIEMAVVVQLSSSADGLDKIVKNVLDLRERRDKSSNKKQFDVQELNAASLQHNNYKSQIFNDYADTNFRYLKATGLVQGKGRGLAFVPEKQGLIEKLVEDTDVPSSNLAYYTTLCNGARLPTDNKDSALIVLNDLLRLLDKCGVTFDLSCRTLETLADIASVRHDIEVILFARKEEEYATKQAGAWKEIIAYMDLLISRRNFGVLSNGDKIEIPKAEAPAYFEWVIWRAFLAINSLKNKPYEARRFKIDQDFLPVGTAPGNGPDLIFEFEDFILVVEVTLTGNSRQEAVEGEPVRRHVAKIVESHAGKRVFGLFIANKIDTNTAETFRIGFWYRLDDSKMALQIVPVTLEQFKELFRASFASGKITPKLVLEFLKDCLSVSNNDAPEWKREIGLIVQERSKFLDNTNNFTP